MVSGGALLNIPVWNQNQDPLPSGGPDPFHTTDCGEECAAMRIYYRTGIELPAGIIRQLIPGHEARGETSPAELVRVMRIFKLSPVSVPVRPAAVEGRLRAACDAGIPAIVLGEWLQQGVLHWVLVVAASSDGIHVNDPWDGARKTFSWPEVLSRYAGWCIL